MTHKMYTNQGTFSSFVFSVNNLFTFLADYIYSMREFYEHNKQLKEITRIEKVKGMNKTIPNTGEVKEKNGRKCP